MNKIIFCSVLFVIFSNCCFGLEYPNDYYFKNLKNNTNIVLGTPISYFEKNYGKKDTYPNMSSPYSGYLDDISSVEEIKKPCNYYEDYTVEVSEKKTNEPWLHIDKAQKMLGDIKYSRIDLRLELQVLSDDLAYVSVKYMILR